jgi:hypothetical protein
MNGIHLQVSVQFHRNRLRYLVGDKIHFGLCGNGLILGMKDYLNIVIGRAKGKRARRLRRRRGREGAQKRQDAEQSAGFLQEQSSFERAICPAY